MAMEQAEHPPDEDEQLANPIARAWVMRTRDRATFRAIAAELGIGVATAKRWVDKAQATWDFAFGDESAERARDLAAIDDWLARLTAAAETGEVEMTAAARTALPYFARRAAMLGYDAPRKSAITIEPDRTEATPNRALFSALEAAVADHEQATLALEAEMDAAS